MRSSSITVSIILLVSLAGCSGIVGPTDLHPSVVAPGVTNERVTNATSLAEANRGILQNTSYSHVRNYTQFVESDGYSYEAAHDTRVFVAADGSFLYHHHGIVTSDGHRSEYVDGTWANESVAVTRSVNVKNRSVTYTRFRPPDPYPAANTTRSGITGALVNASVTTTWNESGSRYVGVHRNESETHRWGAPNGTTVVLTSRHTATAVIREDGFVPSVNTSVVGTRPLPVAATDSDADERHTLTRIRDTSRARYSKLGSTHVPRPDWVDAALSATDGMELGQSTKPRPANSNT